MAYGFVRIFILFILFYFYFFFFRRQGFRMITFDRQAGPLQNFNRSHIMVIGRSVLFSDPARCPKHPKIPPPKIFLFCMRFRTPGTFLEKKFSREKKLGTFPPPPPKKNVLFFLRFNTPGRCFCGKKISVIKNFHPPTYIGHGHSSLLII